MKAFALLLLGVAVALLIKRRLEPPTVPTWYGSELRVYPEFHTDSKTPSWYYVAGR